MDESDRSTAAGIASEQGHMIVRNSIVYNITNYSAHGGVNSSAFGIWGRRRDLLHPNFITIQYITL